MITHASRFLSPAILSAKVCPTTPKLVFVISLRPSLARAVADSLRQAGRDLSVVWLPSVAVARKRLKWDRAAIVILDDIGDSTDEMVLSLQTASPDTHVLIFEHDAVLA